MASEAFGAVALPHQHAAPPGPEEYPIQRAPEILTTTPLPRGEPLAIDAAVNAVGHDASSAAAESRNEWNAANQERLSPEHSRQPVGGSVKRAFDIALASVVLLISSPLMLLIWALVRLDGGRAIFAHRRIGYKGKPFDCYKFRTMCPDAERTLADYLAANPAAAEEWQRNRKLRNDPRVTFLGGMLRVSSLDELPQFINVLRGEMSCIGPRPIVAEELERYGPSAAEYLCSRPGITGLWQTSGRNDVDYPERVKMDCRYVRNWSLGYDLLILLRTAVAVLRFDRAC